MVKAESKAERVRAFLVAHPEMSNQKIADACKTTANYVAHVKLDKSHREKRGRRLPVGKRVRADEASEPVSGASVATSVSPPGVYEGVSLVMVMRSVPPSGHKKKAEPAPRRVKCGVCGYAPEGAPPESCPKCAAQAPKGVA